MIVGLGGTEAVEVPEAAATLLGGLLLFLVPKLEDESSRSSSEKLGKFIPLLPDCSWV